MIGILKTSDLLPKILEELQQKYSLKCFDSVNPDYPIYLTYEKQVLGLQSQDLKQNAISIDFCSGQNLYLEQKGIDRKQILAKAIGVSKGVNVIWDITSGLLKDSFFFRCLGLEVFCFEQNPYIFELQIDALKRSLKFCAGSPANQLKIHHKAAEEALQRPQQIPDAIYLDPMFPEKPKTASSKKEMQLFKILFEATSEECVVRLIEASLKVARRRVVLKRPSFAPSIGQPQIHFQGKSVRYDVYLV